MERARACPWLSPLDSRSTHSPDTNVANVVPWCSPWIPAQHTAGMTEGWFDQGTKGVECPDAVGDHCYGVDLRRFSIHDADPFAYG